MNYKVKEHEITKQNYLVMDKEDFNGFLLDHNLPVFDDDSLLFTYWNGLQIVQKYSIENETKML